MTSASVTLGETYNRLFQAAKVAGKGSAEANRFNAFVRAQLKKNAWRFRRALGVDWDDVKSWV